MDELHRVVTSPVKRRSLGWLLTVVVIAVGALVLLAAVAVGLGLEGY